jgi:large subunit ribosomal protein L22
MEVRSTHKYARISPKKARDVAREIQSLPVSQALDILNYTPRKAALFIGKTVKTAIANAEHNHEMDVNLLVVKEATVNDGPTLRRYKPRARGSAGPIRRRTSHIGIVLTDEIPLPEPKKKGGSGKAKSKKKQKAHQASEPEAPAESEVATEESTAAENKS